jgi:Family of unknown function (DUF6184)
MPQTMKIAAFLSLAVAAGLMTLAGCGNVSTSREAARDQATTVSCDWYQMCGQIGPGKTHETRGSCEVTVKANWESAWPPADCDGKINPSQLDICLSAIRITDCTAPLDILNTLANKCPKTKVCAPASTDASSG